MRLKVVPAIANNETIQNDVTGAHDDVKEMVVVCKDYLKRKLTEQVAPTNTAPAKTKSDNDKLLEKIDKLNSKIDAMGNGKAESNNVEKVLDKVVDKGIKKLTE